MGRELVKVQVMNGKWIRRLACGAMALVGGTAIAAEAVVQDFDGWKITIQPGNFPVAVSTQVQVPPAPAVFSTQAGSSAKSAVRLVSMQVNGAIELSPTPAPVALTPAPAPASGDDDLPLIVPGESLDKPGVASVEPPAGRVDPRYMTQMYQEIYKSIPFIRAEYEANPSYIHDSTMEILFGQMRPTVIHRGTTNVNHNYPNYGYGFGGYAYPPLQLVVPGVGLRIHRSNNGFVE